MGFDFSHGMLVNARTTRPLVEADILQLPVDDAASTASRAGSRCATSSRCRVLRRAGTGRAPGGRIALLDASRPDNALLRAGHGVYFGRVVPLIGGLLSDGDAYAYLPRSMAYLPAPDEMVRMLAAPGSRTRERSQLSGGLTQLFTGTRG